MISVQSAEHSQLFSSDGALQRKVDGYHGFNAMLCSLERLWLVPGETHPPQESELGRLTGTQVQLQSAVGSQECLLAPPTDAGSEQAVSAVVEGRRQPMNVHLYQAPASRWVASPAAVKVAAAGVPLQGPVGRAVAALDNPAGGRWVAVPVARPPLELEDDLRVHVYESESGVAGVTLRHPSIGAGALLQQLKLIQEQLSAQGYEVREAYLNAQRIDLKGKKHGR